MAVYLFRFTVIQFMVVLRPWRWLDFLKFFKDVTSQPPTTFPSTFSPSQLCLWVTASYQKLYWLQNKSLERTLNLHETTVSFDAVLLFTYIPATKAVETEKLITARQLLTQQNQPYLDQICTLLRLLSMKEVKSKALWLFQIDST